MHRVSRGGAPTILLAWIFATAPTAGADAERGDRQFVDPPAGAGAMAPNLAGGDDGVLLSWIEPVRRTGEEPNAARGRHRLRYQRKQRNREEQGKRGQTVPTGEWSVRQLFCDAPSCGLVSPSWR